MILKFKKILILLLLTLLYINLHNYSLTYAINNTKNTTVLILCSYDSENNWENTIVEGFKKGLNFKYNLKIEYLDSKTLHSDIYTDSFINLLNLKYKNDSIRYILTLDDEALQLVRNNLFKENSFMYNIPTLFVGANKISSFSNDELKYITGIYEIQDNLEILNSILNSNKLIENIYIALDNSVYSSVIHDNIKSIQYLTNRPVNIKFLKSEYFNDIYSTLEATNESNSAILLVGSYANSSTNKMLKSEEVVNLIQSKTSTPIYSRIEPYIYSGAIGGIVNNGYRLGYVASNLSEKILLEPELSLPSPTYNIYYKALFNFDAVRHYNINPRLLPEDSIYINKGTFNFLVPKSTEIFIWAVSIMVLISIVALIILGILQKRNAFKNKQLLQESIQRDEIRTDFIITISHELRTPLNIIINATSLLELNVDNNNLDYNKVKQQLYYIKKNSNRLLKLISNLIDVTKIEYGYIDAHFEMANVVAVIEDTVLSTVQLANTHNIDIIFDTDEEEIYSAIDIPKIERIILNLLSNSIKFIKNKGQINITIHRNENSLTIKFKDNGIGIPQNILPSIFNKFYQVNSSLHRENEGSGLGLYIVKGLVDLHKGNISVESTLGIGTTFTIELPIVILENRISNNEDACSSLNNLIEIELSDIPN